MSPFLFLTVLLATLLASNGCEKGSAFPPSDMSFEAFCPPWQEAIADQYQRCNHVSLRQLAVADCSAYTFRLDAGRIDFDRSIATRCLNQWRTSSCEEFRTGAFPACNGLFQGKVGEGGACTLTDDCGFNTYCDHNATRACPGTCRRGLNVDEDCAAQPNACPWSESCVVRASGDGSRCRPRVGLGQRCGPTVADCGGPHACASASPNQPATCLPLLYPTDPCGGTISAACVSYAACIGGACQVRPSVGQACGQIGDVFVGCLNDALCDGVVGGPPGVCRAQLPIGSACTEDLQCAGATTLCVQNLCAEAVCPA